MSADALREYARVKPILTEEDLVRLEDARLVQDYQPKFALSRKIIRAWREKRHIAAIVFGHKQVGKSTYALQVMEEVYRAFGFSEKEAWDLSLKCLVFKIEEFLHVLELMRRYPFLRIPVVTVDDAGVWFGHQRRFTREAVALKGLFDTVGTAFGTIIYTTPNPSGLLNFIRTSVNFRIRVEPYGSKRIAYGWKEEIDVDGSTEFTVRGAPGDVFSTLDGEKYEQYARIRRYFLEEAMEEVQKVFAEAGMETRFELPRCTLCGRETGKINSISVSEEVYMLCDECYENWRRGRDAAEKQAQ